MKKMQKLFTLALVLIMVLSMAAPVMAAGSYYTITITNPNTGSSADHKYEAYQIFAGSLASDGVTLTSITWGEAIDGDAFLAALKADETFGAGASNLFSHCLTAAEVAEVVAAPSFNTVTYTQRFAELANDNLKADAAHYDSDETDSPYYIEIPTEKAGYYLIKDKDGSLDGLENKDYTQFILRISRDVSVQHKGSIPTIDKQVSNSQNTGYTEAIDTAMATTYYYKLTGTMPSDLGRYDSYLYWMTDTMSAGIDFGEVLEVYIDRRAGGEDTPLVKDVHYTLTVTEVDSNSDGVKDNTVLEIKFEDLKKDFDGNGTGNDLAVHNEDKIIVVYSATLNENAIIAGSGNENTVTLKYSNNPNGGGEPGITPPDNTKVYSFKLKVVKVDNANHSLVLPGAEFVLYREIGAENEYAIITDGKVTGWTKVKADATKVTTGADGTLAVDGLAASTYFLEETKAPDGYELLLEPIKVVVKATYTESVVTGMTVETDAMGGGVADPATGTVTITVVNYKGNVLPETGGMGTTMFYLAGSAMAIGAVVLLITKKRMSE